MKRARAPSPPALAVAARRWKPAAVCAVIGGLAALGAAQIAPPRYRAQATIYALPGRAGGITAALRALDLGGAAGELGSQGATTETASYLVSVLRSHAVAAQVCARLDLAHHAHFAPRRPVGDWALAEMLRRAVTAKGDFAGLITIRAAAREPRLAADIANAYLGALDDFICNTALSKRLFIERQLESAQAQLARLESDLQAYQARHQSYALDAEARELIRNWAELNAQQSAAQAALRENAGVMEVSGSIDDLVTLRSRRAGMEGRSAELRRLEDRLQRRLAALPEIGLAMARRERKVAAKQALTEMLESQLELTRIAEVEEQARYQVLDRAHSPERPEWPRRKMSAAAGATAGLLIGLLGAYALGVRREERDAES